jgi:dTDP-4-amino-4,6-dideoxygalactose transaminase
VNVEELIGASWERGIVTCGKVVKEFEAEAGKQAGARYAIGTSSCTSALLMAARMLDLPAGSEVIVPSFTFAATVQALLWNGLTPVFCDCSPGTFTLDPEDVARNISRSTAAILPAYVYGLPPDIDPLLEIGRCAGIPVFFDSAQGLGSTYKNLPAGTFGVCEIFSLSPTKVVTAIEGGPILTNDEQVAGTMRSMRDYGKDPVSGEDMVYLGLSARMSELHAAVGLLSLRKGAGLVQARMALIDKYRARLSGLPGCSVQEFPKDRTSSGNYFVLFISEQARRSRDEVYSELKEIGIQTKRYFYPPVHLQTVFKNAPKRLSPRMQNTLKAANQGLALPLYSHMTTDQLDKVCGHVESLLA